MRWIVPLFATVLVLAAPASGAGTGIRGRVTSSPTCPVETMPPQPQCAPRGFAAKLSVRRASDNHLVKSIHTGDDGRFTIALRPGRYRVQARAANGASLPRCPKPTAVRVGRSGYGRVAIDCDSGIR